MDISKLAPYTKTVVSVVGWLGTILALWVSLSSDGSLSIEDIAALAVALGGGVGTSVSVWNFKNKGTL